MKSYRDVFPFLKPDQMLIGAWIAPAHNLKGLANFNTFEQYHLIKQSGINTIYGLYENAEHHLPEVLKAIAFSKTVGIHYLVRDTRVQTTVDPRILTSYLESYINEAAGVLVSDEPGIYDFNALNKSYQSFQQTYHEKLFYVNLMPIHANQNQFYWGAWQGHKEAPTDVTYEDYYQSYVKYLKLPYFSYDFYPFEGTFPQIRSDYFKQLEAVKRITDEHDLISLCFIQTCSFNAHVRIPTPVEVLWQVNTSIAYGTRGIQYFTYFLPENNDFEQFKGAIINHKGEKTALYPIVQSINQWLDKIGFIVTHAKLKSIEHQENKLISQFELDHQTIQMITNLSFTDTLRVSIVKEENVISMRSSSENVITLEPGEAIFITRSNI